MLTSSSTMTVTTKSLLVVAASSFRVAIILNSSVLPAKVSESIDISN